MSSRSIYPKDLYDDWWNDFHDLKYLLKLDSITSIGLVLSLLLGDVINTRKFSVFQTFVYSASEWKVPTTFIYGFQDWMNYQGAQEARKHMNVPCEIIRVPQVGLSLFLSPGVKV